jgi:hypothetical protein
LTKLDFVSCARSAQENDRGTKYLESGPLVEVVFKGFCLSQAILASQASVPITLSHADNSSEGKAT